MVLLFCCTFAHEFNLSWLCILFYFFKILFIYFREGKGGRTRGRETSMCSCLSCAPCWGPGLQPRHVPRLGIELAMLWFTGQHSIHWATPARAGYVFYYKFNYILSFLQELKSSKCGLIQRIYSSHCQKNPLFHSDESVPLISRE